MTMIFHKDDPTFHWLSNDGLPIQLRFQPREIFEWIHFYETLGMCGVFRAFPGCAVNAGTSDLKSLAREGIWSQVTTRLTFVPLPTAVFYGVTRA